MNHRTIPACPECGFTHRPFEAPAINRFTPERKRYLSYDGHTYATREEAIWANHVWGIFALYPRTSALQLLAQRGEES